MPGSVEAIFRGPSADYNGSNWNMTKLWGPKVAGLVAHDKIIHLPTANLVKCMAWQMGFLLMIRTLDLMSDIRLRIEIRVFIMI